MNTAETDHMDDIEHLRQDLRNSCELPEDLDQFKLIKEESFKDLVPGCLIGWYYKDDLEHWNEFCGKEIPTDPHQMPYRGIGVLAPGQEWRGGAMDTEDIVVCQFTYPTEKCYPDGQWATLHRLLNNPELACVAISRSATPPIIGPMGPPGETIIKKSVGGPAWAT